MLKFTKEQRERVTAISERMLPYVKAETGGKFPDAPTERIANTESYLIKDGYCREFASVAANAPEDIKYLLELVIDATKCQCPERDVARSAYFTRRTATALPHDDFDAGWDAHSALQEVS